MDVNIQVHCASLVNQFLDTTGQLPRPQQDGREQFFLGKIDPQDSYLLYDGNNLVLTRSVRRISTSWKGHLAFYVNFTCWSWNYKPGFGGRVVPTKEQRAAVGASFNQPEGQIEPSAFFDEEAGTSSSEVSGGTEGRGGSW